MPIGFTVEYDTGISDIQYTGKCFIFPLSWSQGIIHTKILPKVKIIVITRKLVAFWDPGQSSIIFTIFRKEAFGASSNVLHPRALVPWVCSTLLLLPVGTICRYNLMKIILRLNLMKTILRLNLMKTILQLNLMKLYALSNL